MPEDQKLLTIGEVAKIIGITRRIILHYEECGLIRPDVKNGPTGNRYYTIDTVTQIRTIRLFQDLGLSLDEIGRYFDGSLDLLPIIHRLEVMRDKLDHNIEKLKERTKDASSQIKRILLPHQTIYCRIYPAATIAERTALLRNTALEGMQLYGTDLTRRMYFIEHPLKGQTSDISFCVAVPQDSKGEYIKDIPQFAFTITVPMRNCRMSRGGFCSMRKNRISNLSGCSGTPSWRGRHNTQIKAGSLRRWHCQ